MKDIIEKFLVCSFVASVVIGVCMLMQHYIFHEAISFGCVVFSWFVAVTAGMLTPYSGSKDKKNDRR